MKTIFEIVSALKVCIISSFITLGATSVVFIVSIVLTNPVTAQASNKARQIQEKSIKTTRLAGSESVATMTIIDQKGRKRVRKIAQVTKLTDNGATEKKMMKFIAPAEVKGTGLLTFDYEDKSDDKWLYMPALRKTRRIVSSENAMSFMGSEFYYADITPPNIDEFTYRLLGEENVNGIDCWKLEVIPINEDVADENGFSKKIVYIGQDYVVRKAIFYDLDEELHKEMVVLAIKEVDPENHKFRLMHLEMTNLQNERRSTLKVDSIQYSEKIKDSYFTKRFLER